ncbi:hypothetical protein F4776DRAFT_634420 [Hypoxylon sp. NC0597]|nr:hypothetical protein F4776DRAFT_634420 [Hypoxylon sp. NC0597]
MDYDALLGAPVQHLSIAHRVSRISERTTARPKDSAYCLVGIFGINMLVLYGEGIENAFFRRQVDIL